MEQNQTQNAATTEGQEQTPIEPISNPFSDGSWANEPVKAAEVVNQEQPEHKETPPPQTEVKPTETPDVTALLKEKLGFDDWDLAANEIKKLKESPKIKFENEQSEIVFEYIKQGKEDDLYTFLDEKRKIDKLTSLEIKDAKTAAEIVKMSMYQKNKTLEKDEIDFLFNEKFSVPRKPEQGIDELDEDYDKRVSEWENKVSEIEKRLVIEAKLAKPDLESKKANLILPDIREKEVVKLPSEEELKEKHTYLDNLKGALNKTLTEFDGFAATVKDEEGDISIAYIPSEEEKKSVADKLNYFVEQNLDANVIFAERWVNDDGSINVKQMTKDLLLIENEQKITQKYANEAASKKMTNYLKRQSNIALNGGSVQHTFDPSNNQSEMEKLAAVMFAK